MIIQAEIIEEPRRRCLPSHHRLSLRSLRATESAHGALLKREFFNRICPLRSYTGLSALSES
jgi:hypothetical protein